MNAIRIRKHLDSDTLHLPELRELIGRDVVIVVAEAAPTPLPPLTNEAGQRFWQRRTLEELAAEQGYKPRSVDELRGDLPADAFEGFEEFLDEMRGRSRNKGTD